jgi:hypothetical protein
MYGTCTNTGYVYQYQERTWYLEFPCSIDSFILAYIIVFVSINPKHTDSPTKTTQSLAIDHCNVEMAISSIKQTFLLVLLLAILSGKLVTLTFRYNESIVYFRLLLHKYSFDTTNLRYTFDKSGCDATACRLKGCHCDFELLI